MELQLTLEVSEFLIKNGKALIISNFSEELNNFFKAKNYGEGILSLFIGIICVAPEFDSFFKIRKPKYKRGQEIIVQDENEIQIESCLRIDLKLCYGKFIHSNEIEARGLLGLEVLNSLGVFDELNIKDFNSINFKEDLRIYLTEQKIIR